MARIFGLVSNAPGRTRVFEAKKFGHFAPNLKVAFSSKNANGALTGWASAGKPPLEFEDSDFSVILDGTIFSIDGKRPEGIERLVLESLHAEKFGKLLTRLNGDFALAAHDKKSGALILARDRFGLRPLYFGAYNGSAAFASLPIAVAQLVGRKLESRISFVARYLAAHYRFFDNDPELSPYADIYQVAPGQIVFLTADNAKRETYWELKDKGDLDLPENELAAKYRELLLDAVKIRAKAGSEKRAYTLSGGMDSSSVLAASVKELGAKQIAYSSVYTDKTYDESDEIQSMLESSVSEWRTVKIEIPDTFGLIEKLVQIHEEPVVTATWLSHFLLSGRIGEHGIQSLFGGLGGDELNAGEYEYFWYFFADLKTTGQSELMLQEIDWWVKYHDHPIFKKSRAIVESTLPKMADLSHPGRCIADSDRMFRYKSVLNQDYFDMGTVKPLMRTPFQSYLKNRCFQDLTVETAPPCLRAEDRHGGYFGTENYLPFMDYRLAELMFQVKGTQKIRAGVTKHLLREAMKGILPEETRTRVKKTGWNAPAHVWFSGQGSDNLMDMIRSQSFRERGIYNVPEIERIVKEHHEIVAQGQQRDNHMMFLWQLVNLELWLRAQSSVLIQ